MSFDKSDGARIEIVFSEVVNPITPVLGQEWRSLLDEVVTTLNQYDVSTPTSALNDGLAESPAPYWRGTTAVNWIKIALLTSKIITGFRWYVYSSTYYPLTFTVSGSNDDSNWTPLSDIFTGVGTVGWQTFYFNNDEAYLYYRIDILTAASPSRIYISEVELYFAYGNETAFTVTGNEYDFVPGGNLENKTKRVDYIENKTGLVVVLDLASAVPNGLFLSEGALRLEEVHDG